MGAGVVYAAADCAGEAGAVTVANVAVDCAGEAGAVTAAVRGVVGLGTAAAPDVCPAGGEGGVPASGGAGAWALAWSCFT